MVNDFSILVNTTDSFEDCWVPFFSLFKKFWPDYSGKIYLNTEYKIFTFPGLDIISVQNSEKVWSSCVKKALDLINERYVLYLQEDYFLKSTVQSEHLAQYFDFMVKHSIDCLHLTDQHSKGPFHKRNIQDFVEIDQKADDRISCQAAIWKKDVLYSYLRKGESGWHFETYGTMRSHFIKHRFYAIDHSIVHLNQFEIIPYIFTGIVKGQWWHEVKPLFSANNIIIDFSKRGFYQPPLKLSLKRRFFAKLKRQPKYWLTIWDIILIKVITH